MYVGGGCDGTCGHVVAAGGVVPMGCLVNIASCCCVFNKASRSSLVSADNAETLLFVAWLEVFFASCTCCIWAINPSLIDDQLLSSVPVVLLTPWYPMVPAMPAPKCMRRLYDSVKCILNSGHDWFMMSTAFHSKIDVS